MAAKRSIRDFFRPAQLPLSSDSQRAALQSAPSNFPPSSSLSSPPTSDFIQDSSSTPSDQLLPLPCSHAQPCEDILEMEIQNSDDGGEDSDSSLEDLATLLASKSSEIKSRRSSLNHDVPSTPVRSSKYQRAAYGFPASPLTFQPKYNFDLSSLVKHAAKDAATKASSVRVKTMLAEHQGGDLSVKENRASKSTILSHSALLETVVAEADDGTADKVNRAIMRTEAIITEKRWYFFDTKPQMAEPERKPFPVNAVRQNWCRELKDPRSRYQTFISGFAEDMVMFGRSLPDEIFMWMLDEVCVEKETPLRASYVNTLGESGEQIKRLMTPESIQRIFCRTGGTIHATSITETIHPVPKVTDPYRQKDWAILGSIIVLMSQVSGKLTSASRLFVTVILLRLSVDHLIKDNIDLLVSVQETLCRLCRATPDMEWGSFCQEVSKMLLNCIELSTLRQRIVESISSTTPRTHDLRRRLAMCFFFDDILYSLDHSYNSTNLERFIERLRSTVSQISTETDWREIGALIAILDIAIDDGKSSKVDLSNVEVEAKFNMDVDVICIMIKDIMRSVGSAGAAFMSRLAAKESLELVSQRIADTVRTKPKPREGWFDRPRGRQEQTFEEERSGMDSFVTKMQRITNGNGRKLNVAR